MSGMTSIPHHGSQKSVDENHAGTNTLDRRRSSFNSKCVLILIQRWIQWKERGCPQKKRAFAGSVCIFVHDLGFPFLKFPALC